MVIFNIIFAIIIIGLIITFILVLIKWIKYGINWLDDISERIIFHIERNYKIREYNMQTERIKAEAMRDKVNQDKAKSSDEYHE